MKQIVRYLTLFVVAFLPFALGACVETENALPQTSGEKSGAANIEKSLARFEGLTFNAKVPLVYNNEKADVTITFSKQMDLRYRAMFNIVWSDGGRYNWPAKIATNGNGFTATSPSGTAEYLFEIRNDRLWLQSLYKTNPGKYAPKWVIGGGTWFDEAPKNYVDPDIALLENSPEFTGTWKSPTGKGGFVTGKLRLNFNPDVAEQAFFTSFKSDGEPHDPWISLVDIRGKYIRLDSGYRTDTLRMRFVSGRIILEGWYFLTRANGTKARGLVELSAPHPSTTVTVTR